MATIKVEDAAAVAGWSTNPNIPIAQRLRAGAAVVDFYVERWDRLHSLLDDLRTSYPDPAPNSTEAIVIERLGAILERDDEDDDR
ncbi:hypothetical protein ACFV9C_44265 [Kribbella sp. NPDC059898]|uniref:hypothetical protein n=1 Tax=Kribbella sp. NPDC059898 TaxID=3346995 RepID=UPI0036675808